MEIEKGEVFEIGEIGREMSGDEVGSETQRLEAREAAYGVGRDGSVESEGW